MSWALSIAKGPWVVASGAKEYSTTCGWYPDSPTATSCRLGESATQEGEIARSFRPPSSDVYGDPGLSPLFMLLLMPPFLMLLKELLAFLPKLWLMPLLVLRPDPIELLNEDLRTFAGTPMRNPNISLFGAVPLDPRELATPAPAFDTEKSGDTVQKNRSSIPTALSQPELILVLLRLLVYS